MVPVINLKKIKVGSECSTFLDLLSACVQWKRDEREKLNVSID